MAVRIDDVPTPTVLGVAVRVQTGKMGDGSDTIVVFAAAYELLLSFDSVTCNQASAIAPK